MQAYTLASNLGAFMLHIKKRKAITFTCSPNEFPHHTLDMKQTNVVIKYPADRDIQVLLEGEDHAEILENAFAAFNCGSGREHPQFLASRMRSLAVNDLVQIDGAWYQCKMVGWEAIADEDAQELEKAIKEHASYALHGAYFALSEVMWSRCNK